MAFESLFSLTLFFAIFLRTDPVLPAVRAELIGTKSTSDDDDASSDRGILTSIIKAVNARSPPAASTKRDFGTFLASMI